MYESILARGCVPFSLRHYSRFYTRYYPLTLFYNGEIGVGRKGERKSQNNRNPLVESRG